MARAEGDTLFEVFLGSKSWSSWFLVLLFFGMMGQMMSEIFGVDFGDEQVFCLCLEALFGNDEMKGCCFVFLKLFRVHWGDFVSRTSS